MVSLLYVTGIKCEGVENTDRWFVPEIGYLPRKTKRRGKSKGQIVAIEPKTD